MWSFWQPALWGAILTKGNPQPPHPPERDFNGTHSNNLHRGPGCPSYGPGLFTAASATIKDTTGTISSLSFIKYCYTFCFQETFVVKQPHKLSSYQWMTMFDCLSLYDWIQCMVYPFEMLTGNLLTYIEIKWLWIRGWLCSLRSIKMWYTC